MLAGRAFPVNRIRVVPTTTQQGLNSPRGSRVSYVFGISRSGNCPKPSPTSHSSAFFCWHMLASVSRTVCRRRPDLAQRWFSASSMRKQAGFFSTAEGDAQENVESQPESQTRGRDVREDPTYEQWLDTIGRQYKRTDRRNWLGGSVVRPCFALYAYILGS